MKFDNLREYFFAYRNGDISRTELEVMIAMWQRAGAML